MKNSIIKKIRPTSSPNANGKTSNSMRISSKHSMKTIKLPPQECNLKPLKSQSIQTEKSLTSWSEQPTVQEKPWLSWCLSSTPSSQDSASLKIKHCTVLIIQQGKSSKKWNFQASGYHHCPNKYSGRSTPANSWFLQIIRRDKKIRKA